MKDKYLSILEELYKIADNEQAILERDIKAPICIPNCGACCEQNSITASGPEARLIVNWLDKQPEKIRKQVLKACEDWLVKRDKYINVYHGPGTGNCTPNEIDRANNESQYVFVKTPCPLIDDEKRCMIHPVRPMVCRCFGVTRLISRDVCPRPMGQGETEDYRAYRWNSKGTRKMAELVKELEEVRHQSNGYRPHNVFIAPAILMEMEPQRFYMMLYYNTVPTARLLMFNETAILWQDQWQEITDREAEMRFLCSPIPALNDPRDINVAHVHEHRLLKMDEEE